MSTKTIALLIATLCTVSGHWGRRYGGYQTFRNSGGFKGFSLKSYYDDVWTSTGTVPEKLSEVPLEPLAMRVAGQGVLINGALQTSQVDDFPVFQWNSEPGALYSLLIEDNDPTAYPEIKVGHFLATNIPGDNIAQGDVIFNWLPSFGYDETEDKLDFDKEKRTPHKFLVLVYKQNGRINVPQDKRAVGCGPFMANRVGFSHDNFKDEYELEGPVSGTYFTVTYEPGWTEYFSCYISRCTGIFLSISINF